MKNYIQKVKEGLETYIKVPDDLLDMYALLVLVRGEKCTLEDVHDAWSVWQNRHISDHRSLIPFGELSRQVQELDREYAQAIIKTAKELQL
jgi:hypothetical protein